MKRTALAYAMNPLDSAALTDAEAALVRRASAGDSGAFAQLYRRHVARIHASLWRLAGGDRAHAEDWTQEAFVRAWQKLDSFRQESGFGTWLHRLAVNVALMALRSRAGAEDREDRFDPDNEAIGGQTLQFSAERIDLESAIACLPTRARAVLILHDIEGWKHEEIGQELAMAVGTSKAHLHRARALLRSVLGETS